MLLYRVTRVTLQKITLWSRFAELLESLYRVTLGVRCGVLGEGIGEQVDGSGLVPGRRRHCRRRRRTPITLHPQPSTLNPHPSALSPQPSNTHLRPKPQTLNPTPETLYTRWYTQCRVAKRTTGNQTLTNPFHTKKKINYYQHPKLCFFCDPDIS